MDVLVILAMIVLFSFFSTMAIVISSLLHRISLLRYRLLLLSSAFLVISLMLLWLDMRMLLDGEKVYIYTFGTFFFLSFACSFLVKAVTDLYSFTSIVPIWGNIAFATFFAVVGVVATYFDSYMLRGLTFVLIVSVSFGYMLFYLVRKRLNIVRNVYFYQSLIIVVFIVLDAIRAYQVREQATFANADVYDMAYTSLIVLILITMQTSYLAELHHLDRQQIQRTNQSLQVTVNKVQKLSETDALTGLSNRRKIYQVLDGWNEQVDADLMVFSILMCDVNDFKSINDTYGHTTGDEVLCFIAETLHTCLREQDVIGRWGGDEFIILLPQTTQDNALIVRDKIRQTFVKQPYESLDQPIGLSIGVATCTKGIDITSLIATADEQMYLEKNKYRNAT